jgi:hypothetical protein
MEKLSFDTLNPEDFTVPVIMRFDAIEENQISWMEKELLK